MTRKLIVREGSSERVFTLSSPMSVGRDEDCAITLEDPRLSRHHAEFAANGTVVSVREQVRYEQKSGREVREGFVATRVTSVRFRAVSEARRICRRGCSFVGLVVGRWLSVVLPPHL